MSNIEQTMKIESSRWQRRRGLTTLAAMIAALCHGPAQAQAPEEDEGAGVEEIVVSGYRSTIQDSIAEKRLSDTVVEALSADDIGDLPALSIGEALETLTGAASHRDQGGATEIAIRGLGPFLGSTTINGREATNGSGDRSVNFSQFPSELFNKIKIYKTQQANLIEGGVSGQIALETVKPLDYGKQRLQIGTKGNYNPGNEDLNQTARDLGYRATASYVDQFDISDGELGISIGVQKNIATNPEQEYRTSSAYRDCRNDPNVPGAGVFASGNCDSGAGDLTLEVDPTTGLAPDADAPFIFVPSQRVFRQNITDDERNAVFGAMQWQPTERVDINLDGQFSNRTFSEIRNDLVFAEQRRVNPEGLVLGDDGTVLAFSNEGRIETNSTFQERLEKYRGAGLSMAFDVSDDLTVSFDYSWSDTERQENIIQTRLQSEPTDIFGNDTPAGTDRPAASYVLDGSGSEVAAITVTNFDVTNANLFADNARTRIDLNQLRDNTIRAFRGDFDLVTDWGAVTNIEGGFRVSELDFVSFPRIRDERTFSDDAIASVSQACRNNVFPDPSFLDEPSNGVPLVTNVDADGNVISQGTGNTYATFDPLCLARGFIGVVPTIPSAGPSVNNVKVEEQTVAAYLQANYEGNLLDRPVRGNFGLRIVNTDVVSTGLRTTFTTEVGADGVLNVTENSDDFRSVEGGSSYTEFLPSFNMVMDLSDEVILRGGIFRGLSRPDPSDLGFGRDLNIDDGDDPMNINELVGNVNASGNPDLEPLTSWNFDVALEWYPNEDTILAGGLYYKRFLGGFESAQRVEQFDVDGQPFFADVTVSRTDEDESTLFGLELSAAHSFSYLPGFWSGFGGKLSYNYADSDFEFEDTNFGAARVLDETGAVVTERIGIVSPADIFGLSEHVFSGQLYYDIGELDLALIYKYRSEYFQQFVSTPGLIRYIDDVGVWEARATYRLNKHVTFRAEGINLFDEPRRHFIPNDSNVSELNSYGPRFFLGVRVKL